MVQRNISQIFAGRGKKRLWIHKPSSHETMGGRHRTAGSCCGREPSAEGRGVEKDGVGAPEGFLEEEEEKAGW